MHVAWVDLATAHIATPRASVAEAAALRNARLLVTARSAQLGSHAQLEREHAHLAPALAGRRAGAPRAAGLAAGSAGSVCVALLDGSRVTVPARAGVFLFTVTF